jgi:glycosyltransferase involved in cell wall biosynthesis
MEYMALGKPVVVSASGGNKELVVHDKTGFIVPPFSIEEMAGRIEEILNDEKMRIRMGEAGRKRIETEFNMNKVTAEYVALYKNLLA